MMPLTGFLVVKIGSRRVLEIASVTLCLTLPLVIVAWSTPLVTAALFILGLSNGAMEVAMNAHAVAVEKATAKPIMSSFHALWSMGGLAGAGVGVLIFTLGLSPLSHTLIVALFFLILGVGVTPHLLAPSFDAGTDGPTFKLPRGPLVGVGLLAFAGLVTEGAMANWGTVYLNDFLGASTGLAAAGYAMFQGAMVVGRLSGDVLKARLTDGLFVRLSALVATFGLGCSLFTSELVTSLIGFALVGLGLSNLVPLLFSAAGKAPNIPTSAAVAAVATSGYLGYLVGPPLIGLSAQVTQLQTALCLVMLLTLFIAAFAPTLLRQLTTVASDRPSESPIRR